jgi:hypothetical protein
VIENDSAEHHIWRLLPMVVSFLLGFLAGMASRSWAERCLDPESDGAALCRAAFLPEPAPLDARTIRLRSSGRGASCRALSARKHHAFIFDRLRCFEKMEAALAKTSIAKTRPGMPPTSSNALNLSNVED